MTIAVTTNSRTVAGNGSTAIFTFTFFAFDEDDIRVYLEASNGSRTAQTLNVHFTLVLSTDVSNPGGTITMATAPASGETLIIYRQPDFLQADVYAAPNKALERDYDRRVIEGQFLLERSGLSLRTPVGSGLEGEIAGAATAGQSVIVNSGATGLLFGTPVTQSISTALLPVVQAPNLAAGRAAFGLGTAALVSDSGLVHTTGAEAIAGAKTFSAQPTFPGGANTARSFGTDSALQVLNAASTQNYYFGIKDSDSSKLWIGRGYGPGQNQTPAIKIDTSDNVAFLAAITAPGAMLTAAATLKMGSNVYCLELQQDNAADGYRVKVNSAGGHLEFYRRSSGSDALVYWWDNATAAMRMVGAALPNADNTYPVGSSSLRWSNIYGTTLQHSVFTVATLPAGSAGMRTSVTDANATTFLSTVAAGGANKVPVFHDGTNWKIA